MLPFTWGKKMKYCFLMLFLFSAMLHGLLTEYSASANSLSGITLLSTTNADYILSPVMATTGFSSSYHKPFGDGDSSIYGLHTAFSNANFIIAGGLAYLSHPDYRWQDEYLCLSYNVGGFTLGATQHLMYEKIAENSWYNWDNDFGLAYRGDEVATELRYLRVRGDDAAFILSASRKIGVSTICTSYTWRKSEANSYAVGTSTVLAAPLLLQSSWQSEPARFGLGLKFYIGGIDLMYGIRTHPELNLSHSLDLGYSW